MRRYIFFAVNLSLLLIIQSFNFKTMAKTEKQKYTVIYTDKDFEIRLYPSVTLATIYSDAKSYRDLSGNGFRMLAGYIFGGNETNTKISMTSPVHMDINNSKSAMSFVMPSSYNNENLPKPDNSKIKIEQTKEEYLAVIRFGGYASDDKIKKYSEKLGKLLSEKGIAYYGNFRFLGYNPPYKFIGRRNEIIVSIVYQKEHKSP